MNKIIKMLLCIASLTLGVVEDGKGGEVKEVVKSWAEEGKKAGLKIAAMLAKGEGMMQTTLLHFAALVAGQPSSEDWLTGYGGAFEVDQTRKNRKSEAKAVFTAWASNHEVSRVDYSTPEKLELARKGTPERITKTTQVWLTEQKMGYTAFIQLARELMPKATDASTSTGSTRVKTLTDKGAKKVVEAMAIATGKQADEVIGASIKALKRQPGFEHKVFGHIIGLCNEIKTTSQDNAMLDAASQIIDVVASLIARKPGTGAVKVPEAAVSEETAPIAKAA